MNTMTRTLLTLALLIPTGAPAAAHSGHGQVSAQVQGSEYKFTALPTMNTGWTKFTFTNTGQELHHFQIARLPTGMTVQQFGAELQAKGEAATAVLDWVGGVGIVAPGGSATSYVNLNRAGTYVQLCFVPDAKGVPHLALGMLGAFEVTSTRTATESPRADVQVNLLDYGIQIPQAIKAGPQIWSLVNRGPEAHEMMIFRLAPGKGVADLMTMFADPKAPPAALPMGGMQALSKGRTGYLELNLEPGEYVLACFIPSPTHQGQPHAMLGMVRPFTVQ